MRGCRCRLTLAQGLANHVNNHAEEMRPRLVPHQGKTLIQVQRDDFVKGSPENPWAEVWPEFSSAIKKAIGAEAHSLILSDFSTTGPTERAASEIVLMDCVQSYFDCNAPPQKGVHNDINTRDKLQKYDPEIFALIDDVFKQSKWRYVRYDQRKK